MFNIGFQTSKTLPNPILDGNTLFWYDSTDLSTITKDGSNYISRWKDKLLSGRDLIQSTGANQPLWTATGVNFDGINDYLAVMFSDIQPKSFYIVLQSNAWNDNKGIIKSVNTVDVLYFLTGNNVVMYTSGVLNITRPNDNNFFILRCILNGASSRGTINADTQTGNLAAHTSTGWYIGCQSPSSSFANMKVKEIINRTGADSTGSENYIYNYLKTKYSL